MIKKYISIIILITLLSSCKETYFFEIKIKPNKSYHRSIYTNSDKLEKYNAENIEYSQQSKETSSSSQMTSILTTSKEDNNGQIPTKIEYGKIMALEWL